MCTTPNIPDFWGTHGASAQRLVNAATDRLNKKLEHIARKVTLAVFRWALNSPWNAVYQSAHVRASEHPGESLYDPKV